MESNFFLLYLHAWLQTRFHLAHLAARVRALSCRLLGLYTLSCRASPTLWPKTHLHMLQTQSLIKNPWLGWHYITLYYNTYGGQPYDSIIHFTLCTRSSWSLTIYLTKTRALSPKKCCGGIRCPTSSQHKYCDSPSSHSVGAMIFARSPSSRSHAARRFTTHCSIVFLLMNPLCANSFHTFLPTYIYSPVPLSSSLGHEDCAATGESGSQPTHVELQAATIYFTKKRFTIQLN